MCKYALYALIQICMFSIFPSVLGTQEQQLMFNTSYVVLR